VPIGWVTEGANRNDSILLAPTLDDVAKRAAYSVRSRHCGWIEELMTQPTSLEEPPLDGGKGQYVNRSAVTTGLVPLGVVTFTLATPVPGGATALIEVDDTNEMLVAGTVPNDTPVTPLKYFPVTVTVVPLDPVLGLILVTEGARYVK
jgi:hypothetical protein